MEIASRKRLPLKNLHRCGPMLSRQCVQCAEMNKISFAVIFLHFILWSDDAVFELTGHLNRHNCIYWRSNDPHEIVEKMKSSRSHSWCDVSSRGFLAQLLWWHCVTFFFLWNAIRVTVASDWVENASWCSNRCPARRSNTTFYDYCETGWIDITRIPSIT